MSDYGMTDYGMTDDDVRAAIAKNLPLYWVPGAIREPCGRKEIVGQPVWDAALKWWWIDFFDPSSGKIKREPAL